MWQLTQCQQTQQQNVTTTAAAAQAAVPTTAKTFETLTACGNRCRATDNVPHALQRLLLQRLRRVLDRTGYRTISAHLLHKQQFFRRSFKARCSSHLALGTDGKGRLNPQCRRARATAATTKNFRYLRTQIVATLSTTTAIRIRPRCSNNNYNNNAQIKAAANFGDKHLIRFGNMSPQHVEAAVAVQQLMVNTSSGKYRDFPKPTTAKLQSKLASAQIKTTATATATTNTDTTNVVDEAMISGVALPVLTLPPSPSVSQKNSKTIDFNSRRRRGRLRLLLEVQAVDAGVNALDELWLKFAVGLRSCVLLLAAYAQHIANNLLLLSLLLSLIIDYVNKIERLVLKCSRNPCYNAKVAITTIATIIKPITIATTHNNTKIQNKFQTPTQTETLDKFKAETAFKSNHNSNSKTIKVGNTTYTTISSNNSANATTISIANIAKSKAHVAASAAVNHNVESAVVAIQHKNTSKCNAPAKSNATVNANAKSCSVGKRSNSNGDDGSSNSSSRWRCVRFGSSQMQLIYAFILCTSILLPCGNNMVSAAKPKSATQLQQLKQQQLLQQQQLLLEQQQQQEQLEEQQQAQQSQHHHHHKNNNNKQVSSANGIAFESRGGGGVGGNGGSAVLTPPTYQIISSQTSNEQTELLYPSSQSEEQLMFDEEEQNLNNVDEESDNTAYDVHNNETAHLNDTKTPLFPKDLFTKEQLENGAVICHLIGVIYMFVALAIVCDEFFVPSLDVIIEKLDITDDVAGATFMAAGGSAPELFTSVIGVFISFDDVGIGTIVGSAVFNILFVIGMCALFSKTVLVLTWWPLFRDCSFYSISLLVLIYFFRDNFIYWWEALILFNIYIAYVAFMKWNVQVERFVKKLITKNKVTRVRSTDQLMPAGNAANSSETSMATQPGGSVTSRAASETRSGPPGSSSGAGATGNSSGTAGSTHTGAKFRHGLLQLMIHTIDPLHDDDVPGKVDEKATQLHAIASLKVLLDATKPQRGGATTSAANHVKINLKETTLADRPNGNIDTTLDSADEIEDEPEPLSMAWPDTARKRLTYVLVAPLLIPMWLTLPDTRTPRGKKYFPVTFIGSILWIAAFSYLMVWWANVAGDTARIPPEVMGLTFLAAGTSIPDLITSVIVARKGFGDMAVSSSVGSNIFDVTVGLPIPWLLYGIIYDAPVEVNSVGMVCSITILFMMLIFVVLSIACFRWRMNKGLGFTMFLLYFVFVAVSLMFEYDTLKCPV